MARVLIAGCGDVGTRAGLALAAAGHEVFGLRRRAALLPEPLRPVCADLGVPASLATLPADLDAVAFTAAAGALDEHGYRATYVDGLRHLLEALAARGPLPARVVFTSSTSVWGVRDGSPVDEDTPTEPDGFAGRVLLEAEALLAAAPTRGVALRLAGIYGPGRTWVIDQVRAGTARLGDPRRPVFTNRIHADDAAAAVAHLLLAVAEPAPLYLGVDDHPCPRDELLVWLAGRLGLPEPPRDPAGAARARGGSKRCSNARLRASGWTPRHPDYRSGYGALLAASAG